MSKPLPLTIRGFASFNIQNTGGREVPCLSYLSQHGGTFLTIELNGSDLHNIETWVKKASESLGYAVQEPCSINKTYTPFRKEVIDRFNFHLGSTGVRFLMEARSGISASRDVNLSELLKVSISVNGRVVACVPADPVIGVHETLRRIVSPNPMNNQERIKVLVSSVKAPAIFFDSSPPLATDPIKVEDVHPYAHVVDTGIDYCLDAIFSVNRDAHTVHVLLKNNALVKEIATGQVPYVCVDPERGGSHSLLIVRDAVSEKCCIPSRVYLDIPEHQLRITVPNTTDEWIPLWFSANSFAGAADWLIKAFVDFNYWMLCNTLADDRRSCVSKAVNQAFETTVKSVHCNLLRMTNRF